MGLRGGALLVVEAGGRITDYKGGAWTMDEPYFVASNGVAHTTPRSSSSHRLFDD